jgi:hypothetical protein
MTAIVPNGMKYINNFHSQSLQNMPKLGFFGKYATLLHCSTAALPHLALLP